MRTRKRKNPRRQPRVLSLWANCRACYRLTTCLCSFRLHSPQRTIEKIQNIPQVPPPFPVRLLQQVRSRQRNYYSILWRILSIVLLFRRIIENGIDKNSFVVYNKTIMKVRAENSITVHKSKSPRCYGDFFVLLLPWILLPAAAQPLADNVIEGICHNTCCNGNKK